MSYYNGHIVRDVVRPSPRVGLIGAGIVASGLVGFFVFLNVKHERKAEHDRTDTPGKIATWENRMIERNLPVTSEEPLKASRVALRTSPIASVKREHDAHPRPISKDTQPVAVDAMGRRIYEVPTAQREGREGFVYTKSPAWHDSTRAMFLDAKEKKKALVATVSDKIEDVKEGALELKESAKQTIMSLKSDPNRSEGNVSNEESEGTALPSDTVKHGLRG